VQSRECPEEVTYVCGDGKQMWTRSLDHVIWFPTHEAVAAAVIAAQDRCREQAWFKKTNWVVHEEPEALRVLEALRTTATH
jgi:hypothetical protein